MDTARNVHTGELVEAEELWSIPTVDKDIYICRGCSTKVFPASYDKEHNKRRPYFSLRNNKCEAGCDVNGEEKIINRAKKERVGSPDGFPVPFPNKLTLTDERTTQDNGAVLSPISANTRASSNLTTVTAELKKHHGHTVKTIRPACRTFINYPNDREYLPLEVPDILGNTYAKVFWYLGNKKTEFFKISKHLYYATIRWKAEPIVTDTHCELTLNAGEWDSEIKGYRNLCQVRVNWSDWSQSRRDTLLREFNTTRAEAIEEAKEDSQIKGWLFFVGTQDGTNPCIFHVEKVIPPEISVN